MVEGCGQHASNLLLEILVHPRHKYLELRFDVPERHHNAQLVLSSRAASVLKARLESQRCPFFVSASHSLLQLFQFLPAVPACA